MRGKGSVNVGKIRCFVSSASPQFGRRIDSLVYTQQHLSSSDRASAEDEEFPHPLVTVWNKVRTRQEPLEGFSLHRASSSWLNNIVHGRPLQVVTSDPVYVNRAALHEFATHFDTATGLGQARLGYRRSVLPYIHHASCSPRTSASFATLQEHVKDDVDEEQSREQEQQVGEESRDPQEDTDASSKKALVNRCNTSSGVGRTKPKDVLEEQLDRTVDETRGNLAWSDAGWTREEVWNWPNSISMARLLSGPVLAWMILHELWSPAVIGLMVAGISDWVDGYVARRMKINSVLGSYLDPVADKVLVGSVALSMANAGLLHLLISATAAALVGLVVARDGVLVGGAFVYRAYSLRWQWRNWREFLRINVGGAGKVEPLYISKVNTVLQLGLIGVALVQPALSIEDTYLLVPLLSWAVAGTTTISWVCYVYQYLKNPASLAALRHIPRTQSKKKS